MAFEGYLVNNNAVQVVASKNALKNVVQDILHRDGKGCTDDYSDQVNAATIRVVRETLPGGKARKYGASVNGGNFNNEAPKESNSVEYDIDVLFTYDGVVDVATIAEDLVPINILEAKTAGIGKELARCVNATTVAEQIKEVVNAKVAGKATNTVALAATPDYIGTLIWANGTLDNGDQDIGADYFPRDFRQTFMTSAYRTALTQKGQVIIGGSNYAQEMLARGVLDPNKVEVEKDLSVFGEVDGVPCTVITKAIMDLACEYLGLAAGKLDIIQAWTCYGGATLRALAFYHGIKSIPSPNGQGIRLQPLYRWGVKTISQKSVAMILKNGKTEADISATALELIPDGSRN